MLRSSVTPAMAENSPAESVVGTATCRTVGGIARRRRAIHRTQRIERLRCPDIVGEAELHRLGAIGDRAAADRDNQVGARLACALGCSDHRVTRRVRRHPVEYAGAAIAESAADFLHLVGLATQGAADHQEHALSVLRLFGDRLRGGDAEQHLFHAG